MADDVLRRLDIGFAGGSVLSVRTRQGPYDALVGALADDGAARWHELEADESVIRLDLAQVVYVQRETEGERVGFQRLGLPGLMLHRLDVALLRLLRTRAHPPALERAAMRFTRLGEHGALWYGVAGAGWLLDSRRRPLYVRLARTVFAAQVFNTLTKVAVGRRRPLLDELPPLTPTVTTLSYPSAHATTSAAAASVLGEALPAPPLYACAGAMALSRPYLGVHYPSETLAGLMLGGAVAKLVP